MHYLELGGAEAALIGLLQTLDYDRVDVDLFLYDKRGEFVSDIPERVNLLPQIPAYTMLERPMKETLLAGHPAIVLRRFIGRRKAEKVYAASGSKLENYAVFYYAIAESCKSLSKINPQTEYDLAISFLIPHNVVLDKVRAKRKVGWIHTDYTKIWTDVPTEERDMWSRLDNIVSISPDVTDTFCRVFPALRSKIVEIENILSPEFIRSRSKKVPTADIRKEFGVADDEMALLTIGRFSPQKNSKRLHIYAKVCSKKG